MIVFKSDTIYFLSIIDNLGMINKVCFFHCKLFLFQGYWKIIAYKNQQYYLLFTQYETEV